MQIDIKPDKVYCYVSILISLNYSDSKDKNTKVCLREVTEKTYCPDILGMSERTDWENLLTRYSGYVWEKWLREPTHQIFWVCLRDLTERTYSPDILGMSERTDWENLLPRYLGMSERTDWENLLTRYSGHEEILSQTFKLYCIEISDSISYAIDLT